MYEESHENVLFYEELRCIMLIVRRVSNTVANQRCLEYTVANKEYTLANQRYQEYTSQSEMR